MRIDPPGLSSLMTLLDARSPISTKVVVSPPSPASPHRRHLPYPQRNTVRPQTQHDILPPTYTPPGTTPPPPPPRAPTLATHDGPSQASTQPPRPTTAHPPSGSLPQRTGPDPHVTR